MAYKLLAYTPLHRYRARVPAADLMAIEVTEVRVWRAVQGERQLMNIHYSSLVKSSKKQIIFTSAVYLWLDRNDFCGDGYEAWSFSVGYG